MRVVQMSASSGKQSVQKKATPQKLLRLPPVSDEGTKLFSKLENLISGFEKDDYILAGIIIVLILEGCDDYILLCVLGYLFIMGLR